MKNEKSKTIARPYEKFWRKKQVDFCLIIHRWSIRIGKGRCRAKVNRRVQGSSFCRVKEIQ